MNDKVQIINLLQQKNILERNLDGLIYGSIEIRDAKDSDKKYIYVHYREDGVMLTKYAGEYSEALNELILKNNIQARQIKRQLRDISKKLAELDYIDQELSPAVARNIDFARRHMADTIYKQAVLEGVATTFADTENIIEGGKVSDMTPEDIMKVVNLKHAWEFILNKNVILAPTNFALLCEINKLIEEGFYYSAGQLRDIPVNIGGTNWSPDLPIESTIREDIGEILNGTGDDVNKAIDLLLYVMKKQAFIDGNKRTAVIFANQYLIAHAQGVLAIPADKVDRFKLLLIPYYEGKDEASIRNFLRHDCHLSI